MCVVALIACAIGIAIAVFYILTLQKAFKAIAPENREMEPGMAWLLLVPLFGIVWHFFIVIKLTNSLKKEFAARNLAPDGDFGYMIGLIMCICACCSIIPFLGILASLAGLVLFIMWWVKVAGYNKQLA